MRLPFCRMEKEIAGESTKKITLTKEEKLPIFFVKVNKTEIEH